MVHHGPEGATRRGRKNRPAETVRTARVVRRAPETESTGAPVCVVFRPARIQRGRTSRTRTALCAGGTPQRIFLPRNASRTRHSSRRRLRTSCHANPGSLTGPLFDLSQPAPERRRFRRSAFRLRPLRMSRCGRDDPHLQTKNNPAPDQQKTFVSADANRMRRADHPMAKGRNGRLHLSAHADRRIRSNIGVWIKIPP